MRFFIHTYNHIINKTILLFILFTINSLNICLSVNFIDSEKNQDTIGVSYIVSGLLIEEGVKRKRSNFLGFTIVAYEVLEDEKGNLLYKVFSENQKVTTGNKGNFTFKLDSDKRYLIKCVKPGYASDEVPLPKRNIASGQHISLEISVRKSKTAVVAGYIFNEADGVILKEANVCLVDKKTGISRVVLSDKNGAYTFEITEDNEYSISAVQDMFFESVPELVSFSFASNGVFKKNILLKSKGIGKVYRVSEFIFGVNDYEISEKKAEGLIEVIQIIKENPAFQFEIACFSDARGDDEYNLNLSKVRAQAIVKYLIEKHNVMPDRLVAQGYGETKLLNECANGVYCSTEKHEENRRIELRIIKVTE